MNALTAFTYADLQQDLNNIVNTVNTQLPMAQVILFGSYATGKQTKDSDLDLCIVVERFTDRRVDMLHGIRKAICGKTSLPLDILLFSREEFQRNAALKPTIEYAIAREGIVLHA